MPAHVIDAFVVELGLDPKNFDANKTKFLKALQEMEDRFNRTERRLGQGRTSTAGRLSTGLSAIHHPILTAINQLDNLSEAADRSGRGISRGIGLGAAGLSRLASAGLLAYGAVKAVQGAVEKLEASVSQTAGLGRTAAVGGFNPRFASAAGIALSETLGKNVREETAGWMAQVGQMIEEYRKSGNQAIVEKFKFLPGVNWYNTSKEDILLKTIQAAHEAPNEAAAVNLLGGTGMSPDLALAARRMGGQKNAELAIARAAEAAATDKQIESATKLSQKTQELVSQFDALWREMNSLATGPLTMLLGKMTEIIKLARKDPKTAAAEAVTTVNRWSGISAFVESILHPKIAAPSTDQRTGWQRLKNWWQGGNSPAATAPITPPSGTGAGHVAPNAERIAYIKSKASSLGLNPDAVAATVMSEGMGSYTGDHGTSFGDFQLHVGGGMGDDAVRSGINVRDPNTWKAQADFALNEMAKRKGNAAWYRNTWHGAPAWAADQFGTAGPPGSRFSLIGSASAAAFHGAGSMNVVDKTKEFGVGTSWGTMMPEGMIVHHTGGRGTPEDVMRVLRQRGLGSQFIIDRDGNVIQILPEGARGRHMMPGSGSLGQGRSNANMQGVEIIANDDADVNQKQVAAAMGLIARQAKMYGYDPTKNVFGHGEVNPGHKQATEGMTVTNAVRSGGLQAGLAEQRAGVNNATNDNSTSYDNDVHVGSVNVYTSSAESNGYSLARTVSNTLKRQMLTAGMNTGLP